MAKACDRCHYKGDGENMCNWGEPHLITYPVTENIDSCILFVAESYYNRWPTSKIKEQEKYINQHKQAILKRISQGKYGENPER